MSTEMRSKSRTWTIGIGLSIVLPIIWTVLVADEGLNIYVGNLGFVLIGLPALVLGLVQLTRQRFIGAAIGISITVAFVALLELAPLGEYLRHRNNISQARKLCADLFQPLEEYKGKNGAYPEIIELLEAGSSTPYSWMFSTATGWERNVSIHYSGHGSSFKFVICPPGIFSNGYGWYLPVNDFPEGVLHSIVFTSESRRWMDTISAMCQKNPTGR